MKQNKYLCPYCKEQMQINGSQVECVNDECDYSYIAWHIEALERTPENKIQRVEELLED